MRDRSKGSLGSAELLFVGGGNTLRLVHHVRSHGFVDAVRDFVAAGGDYYGGSAGAIFACEDVAIALQLDRNEGGLRDLSSLSLVREFSVFPHFTRALVAESQSWSATHKRTVLGIPERSGVVLRHGTAEVLGQESVWEVRGDQAKARVPGERRAFATE